MSVWFKGESEHDCDIGRVRNALESHGEFFVGVVSRMPGMTEVELVEQTSDAVTIRTNEGLMDRTNISKRLEDDRVVMEFDERYEAGSSVTVTSHYSHEFAQSDTGVTHRIVISDVETRGFMGFFYRRFGSSKMGTAVLTAHKAYFDKPVV